MKNINNGAYVTMITPYDDKGNVDYGAVNALAEWYCYNNIDGIFASCQSSEIQRLGLSDRIKLTETTVRATENYYAKTGRKVSVVASGHVSWSENEQAAELNGQLDAGADAAVLITNRFDYCNTSDEKWIDEVDSLLKLLPSTAKLGLYECPAPYKRLLSENMLKYIGESGKFVFIKDTCCDAALIKRRLEILDGTGVGLFNANGQTLLSSLRDGAAGYGGVMANFHPRLYAWLCANPNHERADEVAGFLSAAAFTESLSYPTTAKYHLMSNEGINMSVLTRNPGVKLNEYDKICIDGMDKAAKALEKSLGIR